MKYHFIALDFGATSGRTILGTLEGGRIGIKELTRFPNKILRIGNYYYWDIYSLYDAMKAGLAAAAREGVEITSIGIDTWGVDFVLLDDDGRFQGLPFSYRSPHTVPYPDKYFNDKLPADEVYRRTGIQVLNFNTLFQLYAMRCMEPGRLKRAKGILFMPDALSYMLTGERVTEYTIASTSQLLNAHTRDFDTGLLDSVGVDRSMFGRMVEPGSVIGRLLPGICEDTGLPTVPVVAVAGHDTASAVAAVPATDEKFAYLSSGTWSLMGVETGQPVITATSQKLNMTNEGGVGQTVRLLKNITGLWLLERCMKVWEREGRSYSYNEMTAAAGKAEPFKCFVNPDDETLANPHDMVEALSEYCIRSGQTPPETDAAFARMIFESLALKYKHVLGQLQLLVDFPIERLHVIGGGSKNGLMSQMTADATGLPVVAGPAEATALGNILLQAKAAGIVSSLDEMRRIVSSSVDIKTYAPCNTEVWEAAYSKFKNIAN